MMTINEKTTMAIIEKTTSLIIIKRANGTRVYSPTKASEARLDRLLGKCKREFSREYHYQPGIADKKPTI